MKRHVGVLVIIILCVVMLGIWGFSLPLSDRVFNLSITFISLGEITGLLALILYAFSLILSGRFKFLEDYFGGMNRIYIIHHILGGISFILFLFHPIILALSYLPITFRGVATYFLPGSDWTVNFGITALFISLALLTITFFGKWSYELWRFSHKFLGLAFFIAVIHAFFVPSDISRDPILKTYLFVIVILALVAYLYRTVLGRFFVKRYKFEIQSVQKINNKVVEIKLGPLPQGFVYEAGQFVFVQFLSQKVKNEVHPFSISSSPADGSMNLIIKSEGDYTKSLPDLSVGESAIVEGAYGRFSFYNYKNKSQIWIAGGIGIVPFLSMASQLEEFKDFSADLYYCVSKKEELVRIDKLESMALQNKKFKVFPVISQESGHLTAKQIFEKSGQISDKDIFVCGPPPMMFDLKNQLLKIGVAKNKIHTEEFSLE